MNIQGWQKLTLLDYPGHLAATLFCGGCQINCPFCHNSELLRGPFKPGIAWDDVLAFLKKRQGVLEGVCVTGGEPLLQADIADAIRDIKELGFAVKLDTNGGFPDKLSELIEGELVDYVAMDIKNRPEKYPETCGVDFLDVTPFACSKDLLLEGKVDYEFRSTIVSPVHTVEDVLAMGEWIRGARRYYLQKFVMRDMVRDKTLKPWKDDLMKQVCKQFQGVCEVVEVRGV